MQETSLPHISPAMENVGYQRELMKLKTEQQKPRVTMGGR